MHLTQLRLNNFRCYENVSIDNIPNLLFLVGDNDIGKTVIIDAIEMLLGGKPFVNTDFRTCEGVPTTEISIAARFKLDERDDVNPEFCTGERDDEFECSVIAHSDGSRAYSVIGKGYSEPWMDGLGSSVAQGGLGAEGEKERLRALGETDVSNATKRGDAVQRLVDAGTITLVPRERAVQYRDLSPFLPQIERTSAESFVHPATLILSGLKAVARKTTSPLDEETGTSILDGRLRAVQTEIEAALNDHIRDAEERLSQLIPSLSTVEIIPDVTFNNVVSGVRVVINKGEGPREIDELGQGTNRRVWMALQEWQREANRNAGAINHIYLFDEPDTALHYGSQQRIYDMLQERARAEGAQCIVCTHSVHLIDRAPTSSICLIERAGVSQRMIRRILPTPDDDDIRDFMADIGRSLGLTNTTLLYEKAFLLVEGESEQDALPVYYRKLYGRSMVEDGIHIINLRSCGAWKPVLDVLFENRKAYVHLLLDADCQLPDSSAKLTPHRIREAGGDDFLREQVTFIGNKELEDAWPTEPILRAFQMHYPRQDGSPWLAAHVDPFRQAVKPSHSLQGIINNDATPASRGNGSKPEIAYRIASESTNDEIPAAIVASFAAVRQYAGL